MSNINQKEIIIKEIQNFLEGHNTEVKYLVNVEVSRDKKEATCFFQKPNGESWIEMIPFTPFIYIKDLKAEGYQLYGGDKGLQSSMMLKYGISITKMKTGNQPRLENGYKYKVTTTGTINDIFNFFQQGGMYPYEKKYGADGNPIQDKKSSRYAYRFMHLFNIPKPDEQFFISTGIRLFKGLEEYKDVHRLTFDIETTGLRPEISRVFAIGVRDNRGFEIVLEADKLDDDDSERRLIQDFFNIIKVIEPAVITGYNSENFDFYYLFGRGSKEYLNIDWKKIPTSRNEKIQYRRNKNATLKVGNTKEDYVSTIMWGYNVIDTQHAAKRTAAVNTDLKNTKLKYVAKFEGIAKENRMYIEGDFIGKMWRNNKIHIINPFNNNYIQVPEKHQEIASKLLLLQQNKPDLSEVDYITYRNAFLKEDDEFVKWFRTNVIRLFIDDESEKPVINFIEGKDILRRYLLDDLWETEQVDNLYNQSSFLLAKLVPTNFARVSTMGNAAVWNLLMTAWSYENNLAIPQPDVAENFSGGLARCYKKGWTNRLVKIDFASLYPMIQLTWGVFPMFDITGVIEKMLTYMTTIRNIYKKLANGDSLLEEEISLMETIDHETYDKYINNSFTNEERKMYKTKQLPIKILNNSLFGALGSAFAFNWSDNTCAARITCTGRIYLRHVITWFKQFGCEALLAVTDGVNFGIPDYTNLIVTEEGVTKVRGMVKIEEAWKYNGKIGVSALIEKFNIEIETKHEEESVTYDSPIYILDSNNEIDIIPICEMFNDNSDDLDLTKERDFSEKNYKVLTKSGWSKVNYVFKHKTNKAIHRIETKDRLINVTEDHSIFQNNIEIKPKNIKKYDNIDVVNIPKFSGNVSVDIEEAWLFGFFFADGSSVFSKRNNIKLKSGKESNLIRKSWKISNTDVELLKQAKNILEKKYKVHSKIKSRKESQRKSNNVKELFELTCFDSELSKKYSNIFYTTYREKRIPKTILNSGDDIKRAFLRGSFDGDGYYLSLFDVDGFGNKTYIGMAGIAYLLNSIDVEFRVSTRKDKESFINFRFDKEYNEKYRNFISSNIKTNIVSNNKIINKYQNTYVYDISTEDETFVSGIGGILCHNTSTKCFISVDNDGEFLACLNLSRINYALLIEDKDKKTGKIKNKVKLTGNTIKSKTMSEYIEDFIEKGFELILNGKGAEFVEYYYQYAEDIYYMQIPLKKMASKNKMKRTIKQYLNRGKDKTGKQKASQAHMELIVADRLTKAREIFKQKFDELLASDKIKKKDIEKYSEVEILTAVDVWMPPEPELDSMLYHINIGERKSHGDVKKDPITGEMIFRAKLIDIKDLEENPDLKGNYNVEKYLDAFNTRVKVLLDGFDVDVQKNILVKIVVKTTEDASGKKIKIRELKKETFTKEQMQLRNFDLDDFDESMHLERKEIIFWNRYGYDPYMVWNGFKTVDDEKHGILTPEIYNNALKYLSDQMEKSGKPRLKSVNDKYGKGDYVLFKNANITKTYREITNHIFSIGYHNGEHIEILRENVSVPKSQSEIEMEVKLEKLRVQDSDLLDDKQKEYLNAKEERKQLFTAFKKKWGIPDEYTEERLYNEAPKSKLAFDDFVTEHSNVVEDVEYLNIDDGDF